MAPWENPEERLERLEAALWDLTARIPTLAREVSSIRGMLERERRAQARRHNDAEMAPPDPSISAYHNPPEHR